MTRAEVYGLERYFSAVLTLIQFFIMSHSRDSQQKGEAALTPRRRVVVRLMAGLGNQLFQYALGRRMAMDRGASLHLDAYWYDKSHNIAPHLPLGLHLFRTAGEMTFDDRWMEVWKPTGLAGRIRRRFEERYLPILWRRVILEDVGRQKSGEAFDSRILRAPRRDVYLRGYWPSPRYFGGVEHLVRSELQLKNENVGGPFGEYLGKVRNSESVSVHIRRGDIKNFPDFGMMGAGYYQRAIQIIQEKVREPRFFVFSDDIAEARKLLAPVAACNYVEMGPDSNPAYDVALMSACKHFINANSTFSWWGAWLSANPQKIVIVPDQWLPGLGRQVNNIYSPEWVQLPV
jgi:hypothetical protein